MSERAPAPAWALAVTMLLAALIAACSGDDPPAPAASPTTARPTTTVAAEPDGLRVHLGRTRLYDVRHQFDLMLANEGPAPIAVDTVQLESSLFETVEAQVRNTVVAPGVTELSMPLTYGAPRCEATSAVHAVRIRAGGVERSVPATVVPDNALQVIWERDCAAASVLDAVGLRFGPDWTPTSEETMDGVLEADLRRPGATLSLTELRGSVVFAAIVPDRQDPVLMIDDDHPRARLPVTISAAGCEPHILIESKKTYVFTAYVRLGSLATTVPLEIPVPERGPFDALLEPCLLQG